MSEGVTEEKLAVLSTGRDGGLPSAKEKARSSSMSFRPDRIRSDHAQLPWSETRVNIDIATFSM